MLQKESQLRQELGERLTKQTSLNERMSKELAAAKVTTLFSLYINRTILILCLRFSSGNWNTHE